MDTCERYSVKCCCKQEVFSLQREVEDFRNLASSTHRSASSTSRKCRGAGAGSGLGAAPAAGVFGLGMSVGDENACFLEGIFGSCQDDTKRNTGLITQTIDCVNDMHEESIRSQKTTNEKFFLVASVTFEKCIVFLYARDEVLPNSKILMRSLTVIQGHIRVYRSAFYTFRFNLLKSIPVMFHKLLPPSLVSKGQPQGHT